MVNDFENKINSIRMANLGIFSKTGGTGDLIPALVEHTLTPGISGEATP